MNESSEIKDILHPILSILEEMNSVKDPNERLAIIARHIAKLCWAERCSLLLTEQDGLTLWPVMSQFASGRPDKQLWGIFKDRLKVPADEVPEFAKILKGGIPLVVQASLRSEPLSRLIEPFHIQSLVLVPIIVAKKPHGILVLDVASNQESLAKEKLDLAVHICSCLGFAIETAYLEIRQCFQADRTRGLLGLIRLLLQADELNTALAKVWQFVSDKLGIKTFYVALYNVRKDTLSFPIFVDREEKMTEPERFLGSEPANWGITGWVVRHKKNLYWPTSRAMAKDCVKYGITGIQRGDPCESCVYFPLIAGGTLVGVVSFQSYIPYQFDRQDRQVLEDTANLIAGAIANIHLASRLDQTVQDLRTLVKAVWLMGKEVPTLNETLKQIGDSVRSIFPEAERTSIHLWNKEEKTLELVASTYPFSSETRRALSFRSGEGIAGWVYKNKRPTIVSDTEQDKRYKRVLDPIIHPHKSMIAAPLMWEDKVLGVLTLTNLSKVAMFSGDDLGLLMAGAEYATVAIQNARHFNWLEGLINEIGFNDDIDKVLGSVLSASSHVMDFVATVLHVVDPETEDILRTIVFPPEMKDLGTPPRKRGGLTRAVVQSRRPIPIEDTSKDKRVNLGVIASRVKSLVGFPLITRGKVRGVLFLYSKKTQQFSLREITLLTVLGNQAAIALDNLRLLEQRNTLSQLAGQILNVAQESGDEKQLLDVIIRNAIGLLNAQGGAVYLLDKDRKRFHMVTSVGVPLTSSSRAFDADKGLSGIILRTGEPQIQNDYYKSGIGLKALDNLRLTAVAGAPIFVEQQIQGTIIVHDTREHIRFGKGEQYLIEQFADFVPIALRIAQTIGEQRGVIRTLDGTVNTVRETLSLSVTGELRRTLDGIVFGSKTVLNCDVVTLYAYDEVEKKFEFPPSFIGVINEAKLLEMGKVADTDTVLHRLILRDTPYYTENTIEDKVMEGRFTIREKVIASVGIPLLVKGQRVGVMCVNYRHPHKFTHEEHEKINLFANEAAIAIHNAQLIDDLKQIKGYIGSRTALEWMRMVSTVWGHSIKREVGNALVCAELVRTAYQHNDSSKVLEALSDTEATIRGISKIPITAPLSAEDAVSQIRVNKVVQGYLQSKWKHARYKLVDLKLELQPDLDDRATVRASEEWLRRGLEIVVENAVEAMLDVGTIQTKLRVVTQLVDDEIVILINDTGPGIPKEIQDRIFREPIEKSEGSKGAGVGCALAGNIFSTYMGSIKVQETGPSGTVVKITLPVEKYPS